jgi:hypothetical protein
MKQITKIMTLAVALGAIATLQTANATLSSSSTLAALANGGSIGIGDKIFSGFSFQESGLTTFSAANITVQASIGSDGTYYLTWSGNMSLSSSSAATADLLLKYTVQATAGYINMIDQSYTGSAQNGSLAVDETVSTSSTGSPIVAQSHLTTTFNQDPTPGTTPGPNLFVNPAQTTLYVTKDIAFGVFTNGLVSISVVSQSFHQTAVPEPSTVVAGALLLLPFGVSTLRILRKNKVS